MARRVYTGAEPRIFADRRIGHLEPGGVFDAPEDLLEGLDRRADIAVPAAACDADAAAEEAQVAAESAPEARKRRRPAAGEGLQPLAE